MADITIPQNYNALRKNIGFPLSYNYNIVKINSF